MYYILIYNVLYITFINYRIINIKMCMHMPISSCSRW